MGKRGKSDPLGQLAYTSAKAGIESITEKYPVFAGKEKYIGSHVDMGKVKQLAYSLYSSFGEEHPEQNDQAAAQYIHEKIVDYVASGQAFDEAGERIITKSGLESKTDDSFFGSFFGGGENSSQEDYFEKHARASNDLKNLIGNDNYSSQLPGVVDYVKTASDMQFLDKAIDVMRAYGVLDPDRHEAIKEKIRNKTDYVFESAMKSIDSYFAEEAPQEKQTEVTDITGTNVATSAAAAIFGVAGLGVFFTSKTNMVGAVVGSISYSARGIIGSILIFLSLLLFVMSIKKKKK